MPILKTCALRLVPCEIRSGETLARTPHRWFCKEGHIRPLQKLLELLHQVLLAVTKHVLAMVFKRH